MSPRRIRLRLLLKCVRRLEYSLSLVQHTILLIWLQEAAYHCRDNPGTR